MKFIDFVYAHIYTWYQKMAENGRKVNPQGLTSMLFGICANGWFIFFIELYYFLSKSRRITINSLAYALVALLFAGIVNLLYSRNDRYLKVYNRYLQKENEQDRRRGFIFSGIFIFIPYILLLFFLF